MSERKIIIGEIYESDLMKKLEQNGFGETEKSFLKENWDEVVKEVSSQTLYQSEMSYSFFHDVLFNIGKKMGKDSFYLQLEKIIGMAVESIIKLRDCAPDGLHAYQVTTKPVRVNPEELAPWEYDPGFWDEMLQYDFKMREQTPTFWESTTDVEKVEDGLIIIKFLIW